MDSMPKIGDLVNFFTTFAAWKEDYANRNPGIVLECKSHSPSGALGSADVLWADGTTTSEHIGFLQKVELIKEEQRDGR